MKIFIAGWKELSLVDVIEHVSFTLWLPFCNFRCPWCNNSNIARGKEKKLVEIDEIFEVVKRAAPFIDYFHVTGGEPTLQARVLKHLFKKVKNELGLPVSMDTNASVPEMLEELINLIDHVAIDVKAPLNNSKLYSKVAGLDPLTGALMLNKVRKGLEIASRAKFLELRTTMVPGFIEVKEIEQVARTIKKYLQGNGRRVYVVQQFIPYETIADPELRNRSRTPPELVKTAARKAYEILETETYYRTLEDGTVKVTPEQKFKQPSV